MQSQYLKKEIKMTDFQLMKRGNHSSRDGGKVHAVVIHYTGKLANPPSNSANNVVRWGKQPSCGVSWHACVDADDIIWCIDETRAAWHAKGYNRHTVGVEIGGGPTSFKKKNTKAWKDWHEATMNNAAAVTAFWCTKFKIPVIRNCEYVKSEGAKGNRIQEGIFGHDATNPYRLLKGWKGKQDPGQYFDWDLFMEKVEGYFPMHERPYFGRYNSNLPVTNDREQLTAEEIKWLRTHLQMT